MSINNKRYFLRILLLFLMFIILKIPAYPELTGTVTGKVIDEETDKGIKGVQILLRGIGEPSIYRTDTDKDGSFLLLMIF